MTDSRANRVKENDGWRYLDDDEAEFILFAWPDWHIESVDDFIDGLHGIRLPDETISMLLGIRHDARQAFNAKNVPLMEALLRYLDMTCRAAGMLDAAKAGVRHARKQREKAQKPRMGRTDDGEGLAEIIARVARHDGSAKELWSRFIGELEAAGLSPEANEGSPDYRKWVVRYCPVGSGGKVQSRKISCGRFSNLLSAARSIFHDSPDTVQA